MRLWKNKINGKTHLVHEHWEPIQIKFDGDFFKELDPEIAKEIGDRQVVQGLLIQEGWLVRSTDNVWVAIPMSMKEHFEDLGEGNLQSKFEELEVIPSLKD